MDQTPLLKLPYILAAQSQKHVTHNEALRALDAVVHLAVEDKDLSTPPPSPVNGARYIVSASPTGAWAGHATHVAAWQDGAWAFYVPVAGWLAWVHDESVSYLFAGGGWIPAPGGSGSTIVPKGAWSDAATYVTGDLVEHGGHAFLSNIDDNEDNEPDAATPASTSGWTYFSVVLGGGEGGGGGGGGEGGDVNPVPLVGVNATADETNRLSVSSPASLFNNDGDDHRLKINKAASDDTASVLFQTAYSGRAEFGLAGDDNFHVKVSPNGSSWLEAIVIDRTTGAVSLPLTPGGGGGSTDAQISISLLALALADANGAALFMPGAVYDHFDAVTYVDVAGATGLDTSEAGVLKPVMGTSPTAYANSGGTGDRTASITVSQTGLTLGAGTINNAVDGANASTAGDGFWVTSSAGNPAITFDFGSGSAKYIDEFRLLRASGTSSLGTWHWRGSNDYSSWTVLGSSFNLTGGGTQTVAINHATPALYRYYQLQHVSGAIANNWWGEFEFKIATSIPAPSDLSVASDAFTAAAAPTTMNALVLANPNSATPNTDFTFEVSRNDGTDWETATLTALFTAPDGCVVYDTGDVNVASQSAGTEPRWRFKTDNGKAVKLAAVALIWS